MQTSWHLSMNCYLNSSTINYHIRENLGSLLQSFSKLSIKHFKMENIYYSCYFHIYFSLENENRTRFFTCLKTKFLLLREVCTWTSNQSIVSRTDVSFDFLFKLFLHCKMLSVFKIWQGKEARSECFFCVISIVSLPHFHPGL